MKHQLRFRQTSSEELTEYMYFVKRVATSMQFVFSFIFCWRVQLIFKHYSVKKRDLAIQFSHTNQYCIAVSCFCTSLPSSCAIVS